MILSAGFIFVLIGAMMWHIAAADTGALNIKDVWLDMLKTLQGVQAGS